MSSCLDVNVSCYSATGELSICKACYRRLIKFKKASDHLEGLKHELKGIYKDREPLRTKRLLSVEDDNGETSASCLGKASKCLQFPINTTCTSSHPTSDSAAVCQQERYYQYLDKIAYGSISYSKSAIRTRAASFQLTN